MGMADYYLKINFKKQNNDKLETLYNCLINESMFGVLDLRPELCSLSLECRFDNLIPSTIIIFNTISPFIDDIISIETYGIVKEFTFTSLEEFLYYVFSINENKLLAYYKQMGYFAIDSEKYYRQRDKLKKYYTKLK